jgi:two-component system response regulator GlrR
MPKLKPRLLLIGSKGSPQAAALRARRDLQLIEQSEFKPLSWRGAPPDLALIRLASDRFEKRLGQLRELGAWDSMLPVVALLENDLSENERSAVFAAWLFAHLPGSVAARELEVVVDRALAFGRLLVEREQLRDLAQQERNTLSFDGFDPIRLQEIASTDRSVVIYGERGAARRDVARWLHRCSPRSRGPFLVFSAKGLSKEGCRSRLFGAGVDGVDSQRGLLSPAAGGSLLIENAIDLPRAVQGELEMALAGGSESPVGGARLILTSDEDLEEAVDEGRFHRGLYRRLDAETLRLSTMASLRTRIARIVQDCTGKYSRKLGKGRMRISPEALGSLDRHSWSGGLAELELRCELAAMRAGSGSLGPEDFGFDSCDVEHLPLNYKKAKKIAEFEFKRRFFDRVLSLTEGRIGKAAELCNLPRPSLSTMLKIAGIDRSRYKTQYCKKVGSR